VPADKSLALAPDLIGIYFGFFFFWGKEKETKDKSPTNNSKVIAAKSPKKPPIGENPRRLMTILE
jgi:hypothetical protein